MSPNEAERLLSVEKVKALVAAVKGQAGDKP